MMQPVMDAHVRLTSHPGARDRLLATMDACRIARAVVCAGGTIDLDRLSRQVAEGGHVETDADNDAVLRACRSSGGRLIPFFFANPHADPSHYLNRADEFHGLEISPAVHGVDLTDERVTALVAGAARLRHPVYIVCLGRPGCGVPELAALAEKIPEATLILGHSGVGNIDFYALDLVAPLQNVVVETSGGYTSVARAAIERLGAHRVLFGSEYPLQHPTVELAKFQALDLPAEVWAQVAWHNVHRLLQEETQ